MAGAPRPGRTLRLLHLLANLGVFALVYPLANLHAERQAAGAATPTVMLEWDGAIPFLPWMVLPYMTSGLLFAASFLLAASNLVLRLLSRRVLCATLVACTVFVAWPLQFALVRPEVAPGVPAVLFELLGRFDRPFNQLPSLHVAYCVLFWQPLRAACPGRAARLAVSLWIAIVAVSTLFTWQHHLLDVGAGLALGAAVQALVKPSARAAPPVAFYYAAGAWTMLLAAVATAPLLVRLALLYGAVSLASIALAYARDKRDFPGKRGGRLPLGSLLLYGPYLLGYWLTWQCVRWRERARPAYFQIAPGLWVGRRLSEREAAHLPPGCAVIDLANELSETPALRRAPYVHHALFDLAPIPPALVDAIVDDMARHMGEGRAIYLHCAMGYSRSIFLATSYLERHPHLPAAPDPVGRDPLAHVLFNLPAQAPFPATPAPADR